MSRGVFRPSRWTWLVAAAVLVAGCGGSDDDGTASPTTDASPAATAGDDGASPAATAGDDGASPAATAGGDGATPVGDGASDFRIAGVFPGSTTDADYNTLGLLALQDAESELGAEVAFSENVAVPDVERTMREYVSQGFNVVWTHGSQFFQQTADIAAENPDVNFIAESDTPPENAPDNLWVIDREFQVGFYPLGALAAMVSETGRIGYIGGLSLPFSYAEVHAMRQAIDDLGLDAEVVPVWTGDFNEPAAAQQTASQMLSQDIDFIVGSLNLGMVGVFEAVNAAEDEDVRVAAKYTDKSQFAPDRYVTSILYDFTGPLQDILASIESGETSGYYPLGFDTGVSLQPPQNIDSAVQSDIEELVGQLEAGEVEVVENFDAIE